jgi:hypothetical protein
MCQCQKEDYPENLRTKYLIQGKCKDCPRHLYCESGLLGVFHREWDKISCPCGITFKLVTE